MRSLQSVLTAAAIVVLVVTTVHCSLTGEAMHCCVCTCKMEPALSIYELKYICSYINVHVCSALIAKC